jgi:PAT family beta-lactamase induction signal transducer AmpG
MQQQKSLRFLFLLFGSLYFVQGVITSYQLNFFKPHMTDEGIDADRLAIVATLALVPFIIKIIFGIISDRINVFGLGHRVPYMIIGVLLCSLAFFVAYFIDPSLNFTVLASMVLAATFAMALFDTTADAFAIEVIPANEYSRVQSVMTGGRASGLIILSFVFGLLAARFGYSLIFLVISGLLLLPLILLFRIKEPTIQSKRQGFDWRAFKVMLRTSNLLFAAFLILSWFAFQGIDGLVTLYMSSDLSAPPQILGTYGTIKGIGMVLGAILMSLIAKKWGLKTAGLTTLILVSIGGFSLSFIENVNFILMMAIVLGIVAGLQWTVYASMAMGFTDLRIAGSMFALFQMMANLGIASGEGIATSLSNNEMGFTGVFRLLATINLLLIPFFLFVMRYVTQQIEKDKGEPHAAVELSPKSAD